MSMEILYSGSAPIGLEGNIEQIMGLKERFGYLFNKYFLYYDGIRSYTVGYNIQNNVSPEIITNIIAYRIICVVEGKNIELVGAYVHENPTDIKSCKNALSHIPISHEEKTSLLTELITLERAITF